MPIFVEVIPAGNLAFLNELLKALKVINPLVLTPHCVYGLQKNSNENGSLTHALASSPETGMTEPTTVSIGSAEANQHTKITMNRIISTTILVDICNIYLIAIRPCSLCNLQLQDVRITSHSFLEMSVKD